MSRAEFGRDRGLQTRMLLTMFLLGLVYAVLIAVAIGAGAGAAAVLVIAGALLAIQLAASDKIALAAIGAREVAPAEAPELHAIIERLCVQADLPKPRVAVVAASMPNAFALGRSPQSATVCTTTGLLTLLSPAELEGVLAHELTHVINRDVMVMTIASFFASIAALLIRFGFFFGGGGRGRNQQGAAAMMAVISVSVVVYAVSFVLLRTLSRYREYAADRGAAVLTGRPSALSSALLKISGAMESIPDRDLRKVSQMNAFFILPARRRPLAGLLADHPPIEKRIAALQRLESQLQNGR
jgi:heat shock protein HtpX